MPTNPITLCRFGSPPIPFAFPSLAHLSTPSESAGFQRVHSMAEHSMQRRCTGTVCNRLRAQKGRAQDHHPTDLRSWGGRIWGRTHCSQDFTSMFSCVTGDCGSEKIECSGNSGALPATLAKFMLNGAGGFDFFVISLVDGYNLPMMVTPHGGTTNHN
jgi:hypothetical protein